MTPIDVTALPELSAPFWFIELFKIIGFVLHSIPMHLWLVGFPIALLLVLFNRRNGGFYGRRLLGEFPVIMALGINFGIVPLLFIQTAYYKAFYSATVLMAVHWISILVLVALAYYGIYGCSFLIKRPKRRWTILCGIPSSICLIGCGLILASLFTFMALPSAWPAVYEKTSVAGAVNGLGTYWRDPVVFLRFASIVGLAFSTLAFWTVFDTVCLYGSKNDLTSSAGPAKSSKKKSSSKQSEAASSANTVSKMSKKERRKLRQQKAENMTFASEEEELAWLEAQEAAEQEAAAEEPKVFTPADYYRWSLRLASCLSWFGLIIAAAALWFLYFRFMPKENPNLLWLYQSPWKFLLYSAIAVPVLPVLVLMIGAWRKFSGKTIVFLMTLSELIILAVYAVTRQLIQNAQLKEYLDVASIKAVPVWNPMIVFLAAFALGFVLIVWMIRQMAKAS